MWRWLRLLVVPAALWGMWAATTADECKDKLTACVKANNCAKKPDSSECKACKAAHDSCVANQNELRKKKPSAKKAA